MIEHCQCCGTCCRKGPPGLHIEDASLYSGGVLRKEQLLTLRSGERVYDNVQGRISRLEREMVRIKADSEGGCVFLDRGTNLCLIYASRPVECRALQCWDTSEITRIYHRDRLTRFDLVAADSALGEIMQAHEEDCGLDRADRLASRIKQSGEQAALQKLGEMLERDHALRRALREKAEAGEEILDFIFGRPLPELLARAGLRVLSTPEGYRISSLERS